MNLLVFITLLLGLGANPVEGAEKAKIKRPTPPATLSDREAHRILTHPLYLELDGKRDKYKLRRLELSTGISATQLKQNIADAVIVSKNNTFTTIFAGANFWILRWFGLSGFWNKGIIVILGSKEDPNISNSTLIMPSTLDLGARFRYMFDKKDGSSSIALKIGYHWHKFPINTYPDYISKTIARGFDLGVEKKFAFSPRYGIDFNFDFLWLTKFADNSNIPNSQKGIGYKFSADFYATIMENKGLKTLISIGYGQTSYISRLHGDDVGSDVRSSMEANHFEQTYRNLHLAFIARI